MKGLPKKYAKMGFKKGWKAYKASKGKRKTYKPKSGTTKKRRTYNLARRKKGRRSRGFNTQSIFKLLRFGALLAPAASEVLASGRSNQEKVYNIFKNYSGYYIRDGSFNASSLVKGWGPYLMTSLVTYGIPKLNGIIRRVM